MGIFRDIGAPGLIVLILGALLIFGPKRLPELGEAIGKMIREFKKSVSGIESEADNKNVEDKKEKDHQKSACFQEIPLHLRACRHRRQSSFKQDCI